MREGGRLGRTGVADLSSGRSWEVGARQWGGWLGSVNQNPGSVWRAGLGGLVAEANPGRAAAGLWPPQQQMEILVRPVLR